MMILIEATQMEACGKRDGTMMYKCQLFLLMSLVEQDVLILRH